MRAVNVYFRILFRNKVLSGINLLGLAIGIASGLFILVYVGHQLHYDHLQPDRHRIYRVTTRIFTNGNNDHAAISPAPLAGQLKRDFAEIEESTRCIEARNATVRRGAQLFKEKDVYTADANFFRVFQFPVVSGDTRSALHGKNKVVITASVARKYFGDADPIGQRLEIGKTPYLVTAVLKDLPSNTDLKFDLLKSEDESDAGDWMDISYYTYVLVNGKSLTAEGFRKEFEKKLDPLAEEKFNKLLRADHQGDVKITLHLQPLAGIHFESGLLYDTAKGNKLYVYLLSITAIFILAVACLNFINFSIVQSIRRSTEVGIRKITGAGYGQLVARYLGESVMLTTLAILIALAILVISLPLVNSIAGSDFTTADLFSVQTIVFTLLIVVVVGVLGGSYPAFYTASILPLHALRGKASSPGGETVRRISVSLQFMISIGLILCTMITFRQMNFIRAYDLGFARNNTLVLQAQADSLGMIRMRDLKTALLQDSRVKTVCLGGVGSLPGAPPERSSVLYRSGGRVDTRMMNFAYADADYLELLHLNLTAGRSFKTGSRADKKNGVIVNEALVKSMGWKEPLGQVVEGDGRTLTVIGVVGDYHYQSLYSRVEPQLILPQENTCPYVFVTLAGTLPPREQLQVLEKYWTLFFNDEAFVCGFLDDSIQSQYTEESRMMKLFTAFSALTIVISCLGLFGLSTLAIHQRRREIGIRRIIGADFQSLLFLFSKEYLTLIILSFALIAPVTWILMNRWLESFSYREPIALSLYAINAVAVLFLVLSTVFFSMMAVSKMKPAELISD